MSVAPSPFQRTWTDSTKVNTSDQGEHGSQTSLAKPTNLSKKTQKPKRSSTLADRLRAKIFGSNHATAAASIQSQPLEPTAQTTAEAVVSGPTAAQQAAVEWAEAQGPFEGPEKLLELWFVESSLDLIAAAESTGTSTQHGLGLKSVPRVKWEEMLDLVKCKVLSVIVSDEVDAYLLSESSMFVFPHKIILKTCGTTTLLLGLERLLELASTALVPYGYGLKGQVEPSATVSSQGNAADSKRIARRTHLGMQVVRCFYSRKSFMFPERQKGPHKDWMLEVSTLDEFFGSDGGAGGTGMNGSAYTVGKVNGDHWLLYMAMAPEVGSAAEAIPVGGQQQTQLQNVSAAPCESERIQGSVEDQTLEILMTHLSPASCARYYFDNEASTLAQQQLSASPDATADSSTAFTAADGNASGSGDKGHTLGLNLASRLGLTTLFDGTQIDAFAFEPCGFSANAVVQNPCSSSAKQQQRPVGQAKKDGYWTIHVTPEEGSSYASFETNVALGCGASAAETIDEVARRDKGQTSRPQDLTSLIRRVVDIFEPGKMSITLFVSSSSTAGAEPGVAAAAMQNVPWLGNASVLHQLQMNGYRRTDRIAYEFDGYDLVFVSFERIGSATSISNPVATKIAAIESSA